MATSRLNRFRSDLEHWQEALEADEWHFVRLRETLLRELDPSEAFASIDEAVSLLLQRRDAFEQDECGALLLGLARRADTTEMPPLLVSQWPSVIAALAHDPSLITQLSDWYRRPAA